MSRTFKVAVFALMTLAPAAAVACAFYRVAATFPLDYLVYGALAGSVGVARLWSDEVPTRDVQLRRFGVWLLLSFAVGVACATAYTVDFNFYSLSGLIASTFVLSGIMFRGWRTVRKLLILLGFAVALPGACAFSCTDVGPDHAYERDYVAHDEDRITF